VTGQRGAESDLSERGRPRARSLCERCRHLREIRSERGSVFLRCTRERTDPRFRKYPPQPVLECIGFEQ